VPLTVVAYFGRGTMGTVLGTFKLFYDVAAAAAPLLTAQLYDRLGDYRIAFGVNAFLPCLALLILILTVGPPGRAGEE